jgi:hypothetical protein
MSTNLIIWIHKDWKVYNMWWLNQSKNLIFELGLRCNVTLLMYFIISCSHLPLLSLFPLLRRFKIPSNVGKMINTIVINNSPLFVNKWWIFFSMLIKWFLYLAYILDQIYKLFNKLRKRIFAYIWDRGSSLIVRTLKDEWSVWGSNSGFAYKM